MNATVMALSLVAIALTFERLYLRTQRRKQRVAERTFAFHRLRDHLQLLASDGQIEIDSHLYKFLTVMLNLGIRNAATLRASQVVQLAKKNTREFADESNESLVRHVKMYNHDVQHFVGMCFYEFSKMLMVNDPVYSTWRILSNGTKGLIKRAIGTNNVPPLIETVFPESARTIRTATEYRAIGEDLCLA